VDIILWFTGVTKSIYKFRRVTRLGIGELEMVEVEDRGITFKSWKAYARALKAEVKCLQQLSSDRIVEAGFRAFKREAKA